MNNDDNGDNDNNNNIKTINNTDGPGGGVVQRGPRDGRGAESERDRAHRWSSRDV